METGKFRRKRINYTQVSNGALRNDKISLKAKGLYSLIQSYITLENFTLYKSTLKKQCSEGESAFENAWKELKKFGYLIQHKIQDAKGKFFYEYELLDEPQTSEVSHSVHPPKNHHMDNIHSRKSNTGKVGVYNNTDTNNTNFNNTNANNTTMCLKQVSCSNKINEKSNPINLIENTTHLTLTNNQVKKVSEWIIDRLHKAIEIFKNQGGQYFALLEKIYKDDKNFIPKKNKNINNIKPKNNFANFTQRKYDYDKLELQLLGWDDSDDDYEQ